MISVLHYAVSILDIKISMITFLFLSFASTKKIYLNYVNISSPCFCLLPYLPHEMMAHCWWLYLWLKFLQSFSKRKEPRTLFLKSNLWFYLSLLSHCSKKKKILPKVTVGARIWIPYREEHNHIFRQRGLNWCWGPALFLWEMIYIYLTVFMHKNVI